MNIFEQASRNKIRFDTARGAITTEDLWALPLTSERGISLNGIGMEIQKTIRATDVDSLVETSRSRGLTELNLKLDIIKRIIEVRQEEAKSATVAKARSDEAKKIRELLAEKDGEALAAMTREQLEARLKQLSGE